MIFGNVKKYCTQGIPMVQKYLKKYLTPSWNKNFSVLCRYKYGLRSQKGQTYQGKLMKSVKVRPIFFEFFGPVVGRFPKIAGRRGGGDFYRT